MPDHPPNPAPAPSPPPPQPPDAPLPSVRTSLRSPAIIERLSAAAKRGNLPGFAPATGGTLFVVTDFGHPFESRLSAAAEKQGEDSLLRFSLRLKPTMPLIYAAILLLTIWPGVWLTESLLNTYFGWSIAYIRWIYLVLTVPTSPWALWSAMRKSRRSARAGAGEIIAKIAANIDGTVA